MMRWSLILGVLALSASHVLAGVKAGDAAPDFATVDSTGKAHKLSDYKGKYVVLEWSNPGCPYVKRHYESKNMQSVIKAATDKGAAWFTVGTGHPEVDWAKRLADTGATPTAALPDADAAVAKAFGAKTTPHMFVIGPDGKVIYDGAIDDNNEDVKAAKNYVLTALEEAMAGKPVGTASTKPYGCGVKYR